MKNVAILGGAGYVGTVLSHHFLRNGYNVRVLDSFIYGHEFSVNSLVGQEGFELVKGDISDVECLDKVTADVDHVIILAGLVGDPITKQYPELSEKVNTQGIRKCIDYFDERDLANIIFISTCSNYGLIKEGELAHEEFELNPLSLYAKAKVNSELYFLSKKGKVSYTATILRFATAFGLSPRMRFDLTISEFTRDLFFGQELLVFDEHTWRPYCHVNDFARLIEMVFDAPKSEVDFEVFNAGGDENNATKKMIVDAIKERIPHSRIAYQEQGSDPRNYRVSFRKVSEVLGFSPKYSLEMGIDELISALEIGLFRDSLVNKNQYGNYVI